MHSKRCGRDRLPAEACGSVESVAFFRGRGGRGDVVVSFPPAHLFFEGGALALGVRHRLHLAGIGVAAFARLGAALRTFEIDGVHKCSLREANRVSPPFDSAQCRPGTENTAGEPTPVVRVPLTAMKAEKLFASSRCPGKAPT